MRIGVLSDTHGLLRPRVLQALAGCQVLLHAGDVGDPAVLAALAELAPVHAVRGNVDHGPLAALPAALGGSLARDAVTVAPLALTGAVAAAPPPAAHGTSRAPAAVAPETPGTQGTQGTQESVSFRMTHVRDDIPAAWLSEARLVVFGHSHQPLIEPHGNCLLLNPGSCGPRRFRLPVTVAVITAAGGRLLADRIDVE